MQANINALLNKAEDHIKMAHQLARDLGEVKAETVSIRAEEKRIKRAYDNCLAELEKWQKYIEKTIMRIKAICNLLVP